MGTEKRARQKELHRSRIEAAAKEAEKERLRRRSILGGVLLGCVALVVGLVMVLGGDDDTESADDAETTTTLPAIVGPGAGASIVGQTPCPATDESEQRTTEFENPPPDCLTPGATYAAQISTSEGDITVSLDAEAAPVTVNNFVVLARYKYYDGIPFHRIVSDFAIQAGDPSDLPTGSGGPGYQIEEEPPADGQYSKYDLAMAKTSAVASTGSQFFISTGDGASLEGGGYSLFGEVVEGQEVVDAIDSTPVGDDGQTPTEAVVIESVRILETAPS